MPRPWLSYLHAVYGSQLPDALDLTKFNFFYHGDADWRRKHKNLQWPMASCDMESIKLGEAGPAFLSVHSQRNFKTIGRECEPEVCVRWRPPQGSQPLRSVRVRSLFIIPSRNGTSYGAVMNGQDVTPAFGEFGLTHTQLFEVMRFRTGNLFDAGYEGTAGNGCWFWQVMGSGIWVEGNRVWTSQFKPVSASGKINDRAFVDNWVQRSNRFNTSARICKQSPGNATLPCRSQFHNFTGGVPNKETYPAMAYQLNIDVLRYHTGHDDWTGMVVELVVTSGDCMHGTNPIHACFPVRTMAGGKGHHPCVCDDSHPALNCFG